MPQFTLTAIDQSGTIQTKRINAGTKQQVESLCVELGMQVISVRLPLSQRFTSGTRSSFKLIPFAEELLALQKAGLSITESLSGLHSKANESQKPVLSGLIQSIQQGQSFSEALANYPNEFPTLLRALVQAAEKTSNLPQAIEKYLEYAQQADLIKRKISNAALYPSLLLLVGGRVVAAGLARAGGAASTVRRAYHWEAAAPVLDGAVDAASETFLVRRVACAGGAAGVD